MNRRLAKVNIQEASDLLRLCYVNDESVNGMCSCNTLLNKLFQRMQQARYEEFVLNLASAYEGYQFYLPAFVDFRGRIYRAGVLHFHERDLSRSFILFANEKTQEISKHEEHVGRKYLACAAAFKYKKLSKL